MAYIQKYKDYNKYLSIKNKLDQYGIKNYTINSDYTIDVNGDAHFSGKSLKEEGKIPFTFRNVSGNFTCNATGIKTLEGCPQKVGGNFFCLSNSLTNLLGAPEEVGGNVSCDLNYITSLEGCPLEIGGNFSCSMNYALRQLNMVSNINGNIYCRSTRIDPFNTGFMGWCGGKIIHKW